jgi:hypothetical protein
VSNLAILPVTDPGITTLHSPEHPARLRRLAFDLAAAAVVAGDRATAVRLIEDTRGELR